MAPLNLLNPDLYQKHGKRGMEGQGCWQTKSSCGKVHSTPTVGKSLVAGTTQRQSWKGPSRNSSLALCIQNGRTARLGVQHDSGGQVSGEVTTPLTEPEGAREDRNAPSLAVQGTEKINLV